MNSIRFILTCAVLTAPALLAQDIAPKAGERDPLFSALSEGFDGEDASSTSLDFSGAVPSLVPVDPGAPVLISGLPPVMDALEDAEPATPEPEGVSVTVEPGQDSRSNIDAKSVKLLAPFPAKPLFQPPAGWRLEHPESVPAFVREVPLANGTRISLSIRPHLLVPDADGDQVIAVNEPGYDPTLRYAQTGTMAAVLGSSVERLEDDSLKLGEALDRLSQLLASLPNAEATPAAEESTQNTDR
ncbi:hypothetical protein [Luteolibacter marinus]|uniref:hypothetical protein n=1 Tax=Luteolibacter marinus TaxID=2776705 RepID=UPI00186942DA|nr:hypothetical protein [Luteolibacter marinus]